MAGMYKSLLTSHTTKTPARTDIVLQQFAPFLQPWTFAGNANPFPMTNLDSMLVHSFACMLYEDKDVSTTATAYGLAADMPAKYLGARPVGVFTVSAGGSVIVSSTMSTATVSGSIQTLASNRPYLPSHFNFTDFSHGQNFLGSAAAATTTTTIFTDTNWIDDSTSCPIYWQIDTVTAKHQAFTAKTIAGKVSQMSCSSGSESGLALPWPSPVDPGSNTIYIMGKK
jgi:hypothetical protein